MEKTFSSGSVTVTLEGICNKFMSAPEMGNWAEGSVESPLLAYWVAHKLQNAYTMEEVQEKTQEFYQNFLI